MCNLRVKLASATATLGRVVLSHFDSTTPIANIASFISCLHLLVFFCFNWWNVGRFHLQLELFSCIFCQVLRFVGGCWSSSFFYVLNCIVLAVILRCDILYHVGIHTGVILMMWHGSIALIQILPAAGPCSTHSAASPHQSHWSSDKGCSYGDCGMAEGTAEEGMTPPAWVRRWAERSWNMSSHKWDSHSRCASFRLEEREKKKEGGRHFLLEKIY